MSARSSPLRTMLSRWVATLVHRDSGNECFGMCEPSYQCREDLQGKRVQTCRTVRWHSVRQRLCFWRGAWCVWMRNFLVGRRSGNCNTLVTIKTLYTQCLGKDSNQTDCSWDLNAVTTRVGFRTCSSVAVADCNRTSEGEEHRTLGSRVGGLHCLEAAAVAVAYWEAEAEPN